jgi:LysM repeat protein
VRRGDTLSAIANRFRVAMSAIVARNQLADPDHLREGEVLLIPPPAPLALVVTPPAGPPGQAFRIELTGARPSETITFEIDSPTGKYTGGPHIAGSDGTVTATYQTASADPTGIHTVVARGNMGTTLRTSFLVASPTTSTT